VPRSRPQRYASQNRATAAARLKAACDAWNKDNIARLCSNPNEGKAKKAIANANAP